MGQIIWLKKSESHIWAMSYLDSMFNQCSLWTSKEGRENTSFGWDNVFIFLSSSQSYEIDFCLANSKEKLIFVIHHSEQMTFWYFNKNCCNILRIMFYTIEYMFPRRISSKFNFFFLTVKPGYFFPLWLKGNCYKMKMKLHASETWI